MADRHTRRDFIRLMSMGALAGLTLGSVACTKAEREVFLQKHFREMTEDEKKRVIRRLEEQYGKTYGRKVQVSAQPAAAGELWGYGLDLSRCIGCRKCVYACVKENNQSRANPQLQWIRVIRLKKGSLINLENSEHYYDPATVPEPGFIYMPVQCQQCENPPCVRV
ncbi:MAG: 4Fe-4S ferredoxin, partial [Thermodesulfobacteriota bacterium]